jgi:clan AA aspartic protease
MGITLLTVRVANPRDVRRAAQVDCIVDSGAIYAVVPGRILRAIGVRPTRRERFALADGSQVQRAIGEARFTIGERSGVSPVVFGARGDAALMGAVTLEALGLMIDPLKRELRTMRMTM